MHSYLASCDTLDSDFRAYFWIACTISFESICSEMVLLSTNNIYNGKKFLKKITFLKSLDIIYKLSSFWITQSEN